MKIKLVYVILVLLFINACENNESSEIKNIELSSLSFSDCNDYNRINCCMPAIKLLAQSEEKLLVKVLNSEFCCGTDSISLHMMKSDNEFNIEIIDNGQVTSCYCPHDLEFTIGPLENKTYELTIIESEHALLRDTFSIHIDFTNQLDTTISKSEMIPETKIFEPNHVITTLGGCNGSNKTVLDIPVKDNDTIVFDVQSDTLRVFTGMNLTCCIEFDPESEVIGDTLLMKISTMNDEFCDCICYYTFDYLFVNYKRQEFYYQFYIDDYQRFSGEFAMP